MKVDRLFSGVFPEGILYADRLVDDGGDYKRLGFLPFANLVLQLESDCPPDLAERIRTDAGRIQALKGEQYQISTSGQTITLGYKLEKH